MRPEGFTEADTQQKNDSKVDKFDREARVDDKSLVESQHQNKALRAEESPELGSAYKQVELALQRMLSSAIAFCDGAISAGQLKAVRELLREQELRLSQLEGNYTPPFMEEEPLPKQILDNDIFTAPPISEVANDVVQAPKGPVIQDANELRDMLTSLDQKIATLEGDKKALQRTARSRHPNAPNTPRQRSLEGRLGRRQDNLSPTIE
jgi:hypothetical protein